MAELSGGDWDRMQLQLIKEKGQVSELAGRSESEQLNLPLEENLDKDDQKEEDEQKRSGLDEDYQIAA